MNTKEFLIIHHTGGTDAQPLLDTSHHTSEIVDTYHKSLGWGGIGYNWFIEKSGTIKKGRDENVEGVHTRGYNNKSIGICLAGNFDAFMPTQGQIIALTTLMRSRMELYKIPLTKIVPHRTFATKTCYGSKLTEDWARRLVMPAAITPKQKLITTLELALSEAKNL